MASSSSAAASTTPPPPPPIPAAKKPFFRRLAPIFFATNILVAIYVFVQTSRKQSAEKEAESVAAAAIPSAPIVSEEATIPEKKFYAENASPVTALPPVPEHEQRELLKWILEEKRKVKPKDPLEKKKIDEEKALLKQLIRAKSIPSL